MREAIQEPDEGDLAPTLQCASPNARAFISFFLRKDLFEDVRQDVTQKQNFRKTFFSTAVNLPGSPARAYGKH